MHRHRVPVCAIAMASLLTAATPAQQPPAKAAAPAVTEVPAVQPFEVCIKFRDESAPPGALVQIKLYITEPRPITTGSGRFSFEDFESIEGIALGTGTDDGYGLALFEGKSFGLSFVSPSGMFGADGDYPILTVVAKVPESLRFGARLPATIDAAGLRFIDPSGRVYPVDFTSGVVTVAPGISVHDVLPGSADLPAGSKVTVLGGGFGPDTRIRFGEADVARTDVVSPDRMEVTLGAPMAMQGARIRAENRGRLNNVLGERDKSRITYFSYHRTRRAAGGTTDGLLARVVPVFPRGTSTQAYVDVLGDTAGLAIQNLESVDAALSLDALRADGAVMQSVPLTLAAGRFTVLTLAEIFGAGAGPGSTIRVTSSSAPVQVMGIGSDGASVTPQPPRLPAAAAQ